MKWTGTKGIEPTRFDSTYCIILRKLVYAPKIPSIVNSRLVLINRCLTFLAHP